MQEFNVHIDIGGLNLNVIGYYSPACPPDMKSLPGDAYPGHGSEIDISEVKTEEGHKLKFDSTEFLEQWGEKIEEAIEN